MCWWWRFVFSLVLQASHLIGCRFDSAPPSLPTLLLQLYEGEGVASVCKGYLHAVVVRALAVQVTAVVVHAAVVQWAEAHEPVLQGVVPLLVHVVMPDDVLLTGESLRGTEQTQQQVLRTSNRSFYHSGNSCGRQKPTGSARRCAKPGERSQFTLAFFFCNSFS